jgi:hypothetical protein
MADITAVGNQPASYSEKDPRVTEADTKTKPKAEEEDDEDVEDLDALIDELESQDGHEVEEDEEEGTPGGGRTVPEDMLQTSTVTGYVCDPNRTKTRHLSSAALLSGFSFFLFIANTLSIVLPLRKSSRVAANTDPTA